MKKFVVVVLLVFFIFVAGCARLVSKSICLKEPISSSKIKAIKKVAIFPFADYSHQQDFLKSLRWGLNRKVVEALTDEFIKRGIQVAIQEDVEELLSREGIVTLPKIEEMNVNDRDAIATTKDDFVSLLSPEYEFRYGSHSDRMRQEIETVIKDKGKRIKVKGERKQERIPFLQGVTAGFSERKIRELGEELEVDAIVRGKIIEGGICRSARGNTSIVSVRVYVQDVKNGQVILSGRVEVEYKPFPLLAEENYRYSFDRIIDEGVSLLAAGLFKEEDRALDTVAILSPRPFKLNLREIEIN